MTVSLRNVSGRTLYLGVGGRRVERGQVIEVAGDLDEQGSPPDGHLIGDRIYPSALWSTGATSENEENA